MKVKLARPEHEVAYKDICELINKHAAKLTAEEILCIAANLVGKLIAMQDQRTMTAQRAMDIVLLNIEFGNKTIMGTLASAPVAGNG
jgi:hypothetical protein